MPRPFISKSSNASTDELGGAACECISSLATKVEPSEDVTKDSTVGVCLNPSENLGVNLTSLDLSGQGLEALTSCEDLVNVRELNLSNNNISELPSSLKGARCLRILNVSNNKLTVFPAVLMDGLDSVKELNLSHNDFAALPRPSCYQNLTVLKAKNSGIREFPFWILYESHFLKVLDLSSNGVFFRMKPIPHRPFHQSCDNLLRVNFSNTYLSDCHTYLLSQFRRLQHLDVSNYSYKFNNALSHLNFALPPELKVIKAVNARIVGEISLEPAQVEKVNLSQNSLVILNKSIVAASLRFLVLSDCYLTCLADNFGDMVNLVYLNLSNNDLCLLPESFANLTALVHLDLYNNYFMEFPAEIFQKLKNIACFDLCMNEVDVPEYPLGEGGPSYETLRASLRSSLTRPRHSGKARRDPTPFYVPPSRSSDDEESEVDSCSPPPEAQVARKCEVVEDEEEDWDAVDPNAIYTDPSLSIPAGGLNRMSALFDGISDDDLLRVSLQRVPARIRDSPFFFYRCPTAVFPAVNRYHLSEETVVEGQFDDA